MKFLLAKCWSLQHGLDVLILKILQCQRFVFFVGAYYVMSQNTFLAPERTTLEAIEGLGAALVAVSTFHVSCTALFNCQDIKQTVDTKIGGKLAGISTSRDLKLSSTLRACNFATDAARSLNSVQAMKTATVQTRQLLWISECTHTHRTGYFIMKIVQQGFYIHSEIRKRSKFRVI